MEKGKGWHEKRVYNKNLGRKVALKHRAARLTGLYFQGKLTKFHLHNTIAGYQKIQKRRGRKETWIHREKECLPFSKAMNDFIKKHSDSQVEIYSCSDIHFVNRWNGQYVDANGLSERNMIEGQCKDILISEGEGKAEIKRRTRLRPSHFNWVYLKNRKAKAKVKEIEGDLEKSYNTLYH